MKSQAGGRNRKVGQGQGTYGYCAMQGGLLMVGIIPPNQEPGCASPEDPVGLSSTGVKAFGVSCGSTYPLGLPTSQGGGGGERGRGGDEGAAWCTPQG